MAAVVATAVEKATVEKGVVVVGRAVRVAGPLELQEFC